MHVALFLHPGLIAAGFAAASVPILIHLFSRRRVKRVRWAAMSWLNAALKRHQKRLRIENWLVLLLRVAALALLGTAIARWILTDSDMIGFIRPKRSVVLLLDTSYSTGAKDGGRSVADRVRAEADKVLSGLTSEDNVAVLVSNDVRLDRTGTLPAVLVPRTVGKEGAARAKEALGQVRTTEARASWPDVLALAVSKAVMPPDDVNRILYWVTDLQAIDWRRPAEVGGVDAMAKALEALHRAPCAVRIVDAGARTAARRNLTVAEVSLQGNQDVFEGQDVKLRLRAENHGPTRVDKASLRVFVDDAPSAVQSQSIDLDAADPGTLMPGHAEPSVTLGRDVLARTPGPHAIRVVLSPPDSDASSDVLALDSERRLAVEVRRRLRVVAWVEANAGSQITPDQILRAVYTGDGKKGGDVFDLRILRNGESELRSTLGDPQGEPDLVILVNVTPRGAETVKDLVAYVRGGGAMAVFVGDGTDTAALNEEFNDPPSARLLPFRFGSLDRPPNRSSPNAPWKLDLEHRTSNALSQLVAGDDPVTKKGAGWIVRLKMWPLVWGRVAMYEQGTPRHVTPPGATAEEDEAVVMRFEGVGGQPGPIAIAESRYGLGRSMWAGIGIDDSWLEKSFLFLPFLLHVSALELTRRPDTGRNVLVGSAIRARVPRDAQAPKIQVPGRGLEVPETKAAETEADRPEVSFERTATSGIYVLSYERPGARTSAGAGRVEEYFAVNPDPAEGALKRATDAEVEGRVPGADVKVLPSVEQEVETAKGAREGEMTAYLLLGVVVLLLLEQFLAMRFGRHDRGAEPGAA